jgi:hypothetical protein
MRVLVLVKANPESEAGQLPSEEDLATMTSYNEQLVKAGIMLAADGLWDSSHGARVRFSGPSERTVIDGPFAETKELVAGFWIWQVSSFEEAVEWLKRAPFQEGEVELRQIFESADFGENVSPELYERERAMREQLESQA